MRTPSAAPPSVFEFHDEGSDVLAECEDFVLTETFTLDGRATTFFNKQGDPVRVTIHADFVGVIANCASGNTLS